MKRIISKLFKKGNVSVAVVEPVKEVKESYQMGDYLLIGLPKEKKYISYDVFKRPNIILPTMSECSYIVRVIRLKDSDNSYETYVCQPIDTYQKPLPAVYYKNKMDSVEVNSFIILKKLTAVEVGLAGIKCKK